MRRTLRSYLDLDERPSAQSDLHPAAIAFADSLIAGRRPQERLDIGFFGLLAAHGESPTWRLMQHSGVQ
jgi:hypothetical protein